MPQAISTLPKRTFGQTSRVDAWWATPVTVLLALSAFILYSTWAAFQGDHYTFGNYLSPFYSPVTWHDPTVWDASHHSWFGSWPFWWPSFLRFSPAWIILIFPLGFRLTCYYYRGAYYKAFWADPPSCTVGEPRSGYRGERSFPLILQNVHRYFLMAALVFLVLLTIDAWKGLWFTDEATGITVFGLGVGSLVLILNVVLLSCYTLGCHSLRHLVGGGLTKISDKPVRRKSYDCVSCLNRKHMLFAWLSLCWVGFTDLYVRLCSMGIWTDWRIF